MDNIFISDKDISVNRVISCGSFGYVYDAAYNGERKAFKHFYNGRKPSLETSNKIIELAKDNDFFSSSLVVPQFVVVNDGIVEQYLTNFIPGEDLLYLSHLSLRERIKILRQLKKEICNMHENYNMIHGDLNLRNMIKTKKDVFIIDFDNCSYKGYGMDMNYVNRYSADYIYNNGIDYDLDIFMFNMATFAFLNNCYVSNVSLEVLEKNYGIFNNRDARRICQYMSENKKCNDFLIDTVNIMNVRKRF